MKILRSITTVGGFTMGSRFVGFLRDVMTATLLGAGPISDALVVAIKLPSLFRRLLAEGAFNAAFIPMYAGLLSSKDEQKANSFAEEVLSILLIVLALFVLFVEIFVPLLMPFCVPGFVKTPERLELAIQFTRITFPFIFFISLTALYSGILNSFERFAAVASSPMAGNIFIIGFVMAMSLVIKTPGPLIAAGVMGCGVIQLLWVMIPCHKSGIRLRLKKPRLTPRVKKLLVLMGPVALGSGVYQFNTLIGTALSSMLPVGGVSYLYYAERLNQLPLSVIGTAMSTVLLPLLAKHIKSKKVDLARSIQNQGIEFAMLLTLPAMIALIALAEPFVKVLFERGKFGATESIHTAHALMAFSAGLPAYVLTKIFATSFYAQEDTKTPLYAAILAVGVDIIFSLALMWHFLHVGIAFATAIAAWFNATFLGYKLYKRGFFAFDARLRRFTPRLLLACTFTLVCIEIQKPFATAWIMGSGFQKIAALVFLVLGGLIAYIIFAQATGALKFKELKIQFRDESTS